MRQGQNRKQRFLVARRKSAKSVERLSPKVPLTESAHVRARGGKREFNATNVAKTQGETTRAHHLTFLVIRKLEECCQQ